MGRGKESQFVNPHDLGVFLHGQNVLPLGRLFVALSHLDVPDSSPDQLVTHPGIENAQAALGHCGVLILDAHPTRVGIFASCVNMASNLKISEASAPVTIRHTDKGVGKIALEMIGRVPGVEIIPVVRKKDKTKSLTEGERAAINEEYIEKVTAALDTPGHLVLIAPFGGLYKHRKDKEGKDRPIKGGVDGLLDTFTGPVFCTWTDRRWGRFTTYMSTEPFSFANMTRVQKTAQISEEFAALEKLAGR